MRLVITKTTVPAGVVYLVARDRDFNAGNLVSKEDYIPEEVFEVFDDHDVVHIHEGTFKAKAESSVTEDFNVLESWNNGIYEHYTIEI